MICVLKILLIIVLLDAWGYWIHRAYHHYEWLWRIHSVHHQKYAFHFHPIELFFNFAGPYLVVAYFVGFIFPTIALSVVLFESYRGHGGLRWIRIPKAAYKGWTTRGYHKRHHENPNINYTQITKFWDWAMGTAG